MIIKNYWIIDNKLLQKHLRVHNYFKTLKKTKIKNSIDNIIKEENQIKKEDDYIEKLSNKISN